MIFFNLQLLLDKAKTDKQIVEALHNMFIGKIIRKNQADNSLILPGLKYGKSFLLKPIKLFDKRLSDVYVSQYIQLAGRRSYSLYRDYGLSYLDLTIYPDLIMKNIKNNYLLNIVDDKIYFKYEEE